MILNSRFSIRGGRSAAPYILLPVLFFVLIFFGALFRGETFVDRDLSGYYWPAKSLIKPLVAASTSFPPVWNPYFATGQPFAANPEHEILHPATLLFLVLPFELAFNCQVLIPVLVSYLSMAFLLRRLRRSRMASSYGALCWAFGGIGLSSTNLTPCLLVLAVLPAFLGCLAHIDRKPVLGNVAAGGIFLGLMFLAGEPVTILCGAVCAVALLVSRVVKTRHVPVIPITSVLLLGLGIGCGLLLPGLDLVKSTVRSAGLPASIADSWAFPPIRLLEVFVPWIAGRLERRDEVWHWGRPFFYSVYSGALLPILALGLGRLRFRRLFPWWLAALAGVLIAVGPLLVFWPLLRTLPFFSGIRYPEKFISISCFALVILGAHGFDAALRLRRTRGAVTVLLWGLAGGALLFAGLYLAAPEGVSSVSVRWPGLKKFLVPSLPRDLTQTALFALVPAMALSFFWRYRRFVALLLVIWAGSELTLRGQAVVRMRPSEFISTPPRFVWPILERRPQGPMFHLAAVFDKKRLDHVAMASPPIPVQWGIPLTLESDFDRTELTWSVEATERIWLLIRESPDSLAPILERRGAGSVLLFRSANAAQPEAVFTRDPRPFVSHARLVRVDRGEAWEAFVKELGTKYPESVFFSKADLEGADLPEQPLAGGTVRILIRKNDFLELDVETLGSSPGILVINQTWHPGWQARVNGSLERLLRCDVALTALVVPPGKHRVTLQHVNGYVRAGFIITAVSTIIAFCLLLYARRTDPTGQQEG